jgi:hypothetical protein
VKKDIVQQYLVRYAENEVQCLRSFPRDFVFSLCLTIPVYNERSFDLLSYFQYAPSDSLFIINVNRPHRQPCMANERLLSDFYDRFKLQWQCENISLLLVDKEKAWYLLVIDRHNEIIPSQQGVGLARKIAMDCALSLWSRGNVATPWVYNTDADVVLPYNYFDAHKQLSERYKDAALAMFDFKHFATSPHLEQAVFLYQLHMRYYIAGLRFTNSQYACPSIGSTMLIHLYYYAMARGFSKRAAGEDFHLMNKLIKLGRCIYLDKREAIHVSGRLSERVPFGTGRALLKLKTNARLFYAPENFLYLKELKETMLHHLECKPRPGDNQNNLIDSYLVDCRFRSFSQKIAKQPFKQQSHCLEDWFDALKTLQFIHYCERYKKYRRLSFEELEQRILKDKRYGFFKQRWQGLIKASMPVHHLLSHQQT